MVGSESETRNIGVINIISSEQIYPHRFKSLTLLGEYVARNHIICKDGTLSEDAPATTTLVVPKGPLSGLAFFRWASKKCREIVASDSSVKNWYITENGSGVAVTMLKIFGLPKNVKTSILFVNASNAMLSQHPWTVAEHQPAADYWQAWRYWREWKSRDLQAKIQLYLVDAVFGNSEEVLKSCGMHRSEKPRFIIPNCVALEASRVKKAMVQREASELCCVSAIQPNKGLGTVLTALRDLIDRGFKVRLSIAGGLIDRDSKWFKRLKQQYSDIEENILFLGKLDYKSLIDLLGKSMAMVHASYLEGSPRAVLESVAASCPVVTSDIPGTRLLDPDGKFLRFFNKGDAARCADKIAELLMDNDLLHQITQKGVEVCQQNYSPSARALKLAEAYLTWADFHN